MKWKKRIFSNTLEFAVHIGNSFSFKESFRRVHPILSGLDNYLYAISLKQKSKFFEEQKFRKFLMKK